ncbi:MAG: class I SAM-dependent methyltransferase [Candidatus Omnitrophica bacterium]|nr:class I SAM-dependent methyltransferase [Candidatus Omnitrophota bacterium]
MLENEINRKRNEIAHFEALHASKKATWWGNTTIAGKERKKRRLEIIYDFIQPVKGMRILEIGCGDGIDSWFWGKTEANFVSMDICYDLVVSAKRNNNGKNILFLVNDAECFAFPDESFDAVVGNSVLHHLQVIPALREIKRVLKKNGKIAFCEPNMFNPHVYLERKFPFIGKRFGISPSETAFVRKILKKQMEDCGFSSVNIEPFDFLHPATPKALIKTVKVMGEFLEKKSFMREIAGSLSIKAFA